VVYGLNCIDKLRCTTKRGLVMDFKIKIEEISKRIPAQKDHIQTEEATKNAFVMPFISALGYDIFNPVEVVPEFTADIGTKKGEKVDYAIKKDDKIVILIECKWWGYDLNEADISQLYRYFSVTDARFGILTNGIRYKFFSDIEEKNKMDSKPFFEFDIRDFEEHHIDELKKFTKSTFDLENILSTASDLKYTNSIKRYFSEEINNPSPEFIRFFGSKVYSGKMTQKVVDKFSSIVKKALNKLIREKVKNRLKVAIEREEEPVKEDEDPEQDTGIVTTEDEVEAYNIVRAIVREVVDVKRVYLRDAKGYCSIFLDNNWKIICRLRFNIPNKKYIGLITQKEEERVPIDNIDDIFKYSERLKATVKEYL